MIDQNSNHCAALINSLHRSQYQGTVWVGYNGQLPDWCGTLSPASPYTEFHVSDRLSVRFVALPDNTKLEFYRPQFMQSIIGFTGGVLDVWYLDVDVIVVEPWPFFDGWISNGITACVGRYWNMHTTHPLRRLWRRGNDDLGYSVKNKLNLLLDTACIGIPSMSVAFLQQWLALQLAIDRIWSEQTSLQRHYADISTARCAFNAALEVTDFEMSILGSDAINLTVGRRLMYKTAIDTCTLDEPVRLSSLNSARAFLQYNHSPIDVTSAMGKLIRVADTAYGNVTGRKITGRS